MDLHDIDAKIDRLSIAKQLTFLQKNLVEARNRLELANRLWERALAAEEVLTAEESILFDGAVDAFVQVRFQVGCRKARRRQK